VAADLSGLARGLLNDMVVDGTGRAWVGDTGYDLASGAPAAPGTVFLVDAEGRARPVAEDIAFPNGMAISSDGGTLYLSETMGKRILAFDIAPDGTLAHKRVHAELDAEPDGLCLDAEGCLWVPLVFKGEFRRVAPGGAVVDRIAFPGRNAIACVFGGDDRRTLYLTLCLADRSNPTKPVLQGSIVKTRTDIPGAGLP
jgi:sugar lactone lactonase YvrE